jgi:redox-sensitive bicupin YhaK (pirin superfamily)
MFPLEAKQDRLLLVASGDGRQDSLMIHQDADLYAAVLAQGQSVRHEIAAGRGAWLQVARGTVTLNGTELGEGDGAFTDQDSALDIRGKGERSEFLLFDLA